MIARAIAVGVAVLVGAVSATAQEQGTVEFGGFVSNTFFDGGLDINNGWGMGGRIGMFVEPRMSFEFEGCWTNAGRKVNVGELSGRLVAVPLKFGRLSVLVGAGGGHTDTPPVKSYGVHGLLGVKFAISQRVALRIDGIESYMANGDYLNTGIHAGLTLYRNPHERIRTVSGTSMAQPPDTACVSEARRLRGRYQALRDSVDRSEAFRVAETRRLRDSYQALRDSVTRSDYMPPSSPEALATMHKMIYFGYNKSSLSDSARAILRDKVTVFRANPAMRIVIVGCASASGSAGTNLALGLRRAEAAKAYLVSQGVDPIRIESATTGERELAAGGAGAAADAANRRAYFRLLVSDPYLDRPSR